MGRPERRSRPPGGIPGAAEAGLTEGLPDETSRSASDLQAPARTSSREAYVAPDRGRQGNAAKTVCAMPFALSGEEGHVEIVARGIRHEIAFRVDRIAQEPVIDTSSIGWQVVR
jgi:hypothetical protein